MLLYDYDNATSSHASIDLFRDRNDAAHPHLLHQVQQKILDLEPLPPADQPEKREPVAAGDRSVAFRLAHSRQREVEILQDHLLALLDETPAGVADKQLAPRDIIVMVPDIAAYAPHIEAVFGRLAPDDSRYIPYSIGDRSERSSNPILAALESLLTLPERPRQAEDFAPKFATSETAIPLHQEILRPSDNKRTITTDVETGWVEIRIEDDFGKAKNLEQGLITGSMRRELQIINPDDPLSARSGTH